MCECKVLLSSCQCLLISDLTVRILLQLSCFELVMDDLIRCWKSFEEVPHHLLQSAYCIIILEPFCMYPDLDFNLFLSPVNTMCTQSILPTTSPLVSPPMSPNTSSPSLLRRLSQAFIGGTPQFHRRNLDGKYSTKRSVNLNCVFVVERINFQSCA